MIIKLNRRTLIFLSFFIITLSNSKYFINVGLDNPVAYLGYFLLLCGIMHSYIKLPSNYRKKYINKNIIITIFTFIVGILLQSMANDTKIRLMATMFIIAAVALASDGFMQSFQDVRMGAYGILFGIFFAIILALVTGTALFNKVDEGVMSVGFSAGMGHKNNVGMDLLGSFCGIFLFYKYEKKKVIDVIVMWVEILIMFICHARVTWILFGVFIILIHFDMVRMLYSRQRKLFIMIIFFITILFGNYLYRVVALQSTTYIYRFRGLINWFNYYMGDWFHLTFGNAEMAFRNSSLNYVTNVRRVTGWDGTLEMAILSVMIKNGLIGFIGYFIIFFRSIKATIETKKWSYKAALVSFVVVMLGSSLSETFIVNIAIVFGPYCYTVVSGICGMSHLGYEEKY